MFSLIAGLVVIAALLLGVRYYNSRPPEERAQLALRAAGAAAIAAAAFLALTGRFFLAVPLGFFGYLALWRRPRAGLAPERLAGGARRASVRTAFLEMSLDQSSGALSGHVLAGSLTGRELAALSRAELAQLWRECRAGEAQSRQLLEAYLDRRWPEWRAEMPRSGAAGAGEQRTSGSGDANGGNGGPGESDRGRGRMTRDEAFDVLGLAPGSDIEAIKSAHRNLMKRLHPDQGGSNYLAAKINEAKDLLTGKRA